MFADCRSFHCEIVLGKKEYPNLIEDVYILEYDLYVYKLSLEAEEDSKLELLDNHLQFYTTKLDRPVFYSFPRVASAD